MFLYNWYSYCKILERVVRRYRFNLLDEQVEDLDSSRIGWGKRKFYLQPPTPKMSSDKVIDEFADNAVKKI
nr:unnamed protein product [Callosobruchus chinensis]CAH7720488.1 unnamed protein product [Callosobruchus chinensis]